GGLAARGPAAPDASPLPSTQASAGGDTAAAPPAAGSRPAAASGSASAPLAPELLLADTSPAVTVPVYLTAQQQIDKIPLEEYVRGVVAAEMPIQFEMEALKAQALAARTYIVRRIALKDFSGVPNSEAWVTDSVQHQAFMTETQMKQKWPGTQYASNLDKLNRAVNATRGKILTYGGEPINAVFFSTSNGYTENSDEYWSDSEPYLRSVASPWDKSSPEYKTTVTFTNWEFVEKLGLAGIRSPSSIIAKMKILGYTAGHRVDKVKIANTTLTGREVRERLGLRSSQFQVKVNGSSITVTTFGYGHGVGMSQWGANGMAKEGATAQEIVKYYYQGIDISDQAPYLQKVAQ
ncbi:stage II sporulation protein D, partial [Gorillibacterium massiliense]|uniref:stage II sporulation protein D n=1 Tax=Gorillibacterium massiliense TaxID=1280390 RepID=UPI000693DEC5